MRRARLLESGWQRALSYEAEAPAPPAPTGNMVLVAVEACGVCHRDLLDRAGRFPFQQLPITPGHEAAGRVVAVGDAVRRFAVGDRVGTMHRDACGQCDACRRGQTSSCASAAFVLGILADGGYADRLLAPESALFALPPSLPAEQAAIYNCTFGTAWRGLGAIAAGQRVLVTGANGGVGAAAVMLASRRGAEVIAVLRDERHADAVRRWGAREVVVDAGGSFHKRIGDVDVALECVGQPTFNSTLRTLKLGGRVTVVGNIVDERVALNLGYVITKGLQIVGSTGATAADMAALFDFVAAHPPSLPVETMPLHAADAAQRRVQAGGLRGRIVLVP